MGVVDKHITDYINRIQPMCSGVLGEIQLDALHKGIPIVEPETARLFSTILSVVRPKNVLEIGCAIGFSSALICQYLSAGGHVTTIDRYDIMITKAKENFKRLGIEDRVTLLEGDAMQIITGLYDEGNIYDFIFLDAAKGQYLQMLPYCLGLLKEGGVFIADDILQGGRVAKDRLSVPRRQRTIHTRMREFLEAVCVMENLEASIIPIGDGVLVAHKKEK